MVNLLILLAVIVFIAVNVAAWRWVVNTPEDLEKGDWLQLRSIKRSLTGFAMFLLGGFLGFTVQKGATEAAKGKARKNRDAAQRQHGAASRNQNKVNRNKAVAKERGERLRVIHGTTLETLKRHEQGPRGVAAARLTAADRRNLVQSLSTVAGVQVDPDQVVLLGQPDNELRDQLLEIAELSGEDW